MEEETRNTLCISNDPINLQEMILNATHPSAGAISCFLGTTRDTFQDKKVVRLEYEAYTPMALRELQAIAEEIRQQWDVHTICITHRLGVVPVTEVSVAIVVSSTHRRESLAAVDFAINTIKSRVPIWKKEVYSDSMEEFSTWKENAECFWKK